MNRAFWVYVSPLMMAGLVVVCLGFIVNLEELIQSGVRWLSLGTTVAAYVAGVLTMRRAWDSGSMGGVVDGAPGRRGEHDI
jgi:hypothetical protein